MWVNVFVQSIVGGCLILVIFLRVEATSAFGPAMLTSVHEVHDG